MELLRRVGVAAWKVASGEVANPHLFGLMAETGLPIWLSTGMSSLAEIDRAVERVKRAGAELTVLQCTTQYPTPPERLGLNLIPFFRERYGCGVGLSDHSGTIFPGIAAATLGAEVLEVHVTLSREMFGPDVPASVTTAELKELVRGVRFLETASANPVNKDALAAELEPLRRPFTKSLYARSELAPGMTLAPEHVAAKKPGTGIPAARLEELVGRRLRRAVRAGALLSEDDFEQ